MGGDLFLNISDLTLSSLETISVFDISTGNYLFTLDELDDVSISNGQETVDITGKNGRKLGILKKNKSVTVSGNNGLISGGLLEMQTGGDFENASAEVLWTDYLTVLGDLAMTSYTAVGTTGAEIVGLYIKNTDGTLSSKYAQDASAGAGIFAYDPDTRLLSFDGVDDGTEIVVYYYRQLVADTLINYSDVFSKRGRIYIDIFAEDKCSNIYRIQIYIPKGDFSGEFSFDVSDSQTVHSFEVEALAGACGTAGQFYTYTVFGADSPDTATIYCIWFSDTIAPPLPDEDLAAALADIAIIDYSCIDVDDASDLWSTAYEKPSSGYYVWTANVSNDEYGNVEYSDAVLYLAS